MTQTCVGNVGPSLRTGTISLSEASAFLKELADWPFRGEGYRRAIERAARLVKIDLGSRLEPMKYWRAYDIWYVRAKCFRDFESEAIVAAVRQKREEDAANELAELKTRFAILESRLRSGDADFHRPTISALRHLVRTRG
jgi:hypothetical protein